MCICLFSQKFGSKKSTVPIVEIKIPYRQYSMILKEDIVLGFYAPYKRPDTGYAVA